MHHSRYSHPQVDFPEPTLAQLLPETSQNNDQRFAGGFGMGSMVLLTVGFVLGIATGHGIREIISRRRRDLAKRAAIRKKYPI